MHSFGDSGFANALRASGEVNRVAFGDGHAVAITMSGTVLCCGANNSGQCGTGAGDRLPVSKPMIPPALSKRRIVQVAAGKQHSVALSTYGDVYTWGRGFSGQLGHGEDGTIAIVPTYVNRLKKEKVRHIGCSDDSTAAVTDLGVLFTWGDGTSGQLGHGKKVTMECFPKVNPNPNLCEAAQPESL